MSQTTCPSCARPASGRFCAHCGGALEAECRDCGSPLAPGARYCNQCGASTAAAPPPAESPRRAVPVPWVAAAVVGVALAALAAGYLLRPEGEAAVAAVGGEPPLTASGTASGGPAQGPASAPPAGNPGAVDLASMTPREAADRLFNRVMQSASEGDTAQARAFVPMAVAAYQRVEELDTDGHYHVAVLHLVGGNPQAARAEANAILAREPQHLFGLFTAAQAEQAMGNGERARELYQRFLNQYETEVARELPEYRDHARALPGMRAEAQRIVAGGT